MPSAIKRHKLQTLKPRLQELPPRVPMLTGRPKTLKQEQAITGRTLALNGAAWRRLRAFVLAAQPLCPRCMERGDIVPAVDVDHIDGDAANNSLTNLVGLCHPHHSQKTAAQMGKRLRHGCDVDGRPLDPRHGWNEKSPRTDGGEPPGSPHARSRT